MSKNKELENPLEVDAKPVVVESKENTHFMEVEEYLSNNRDRFDLEGANPLYRFKWIDRRTMNDKRKGMWRLTPKDHPDFVNLQPKVDHAVGKNYWQIEELVLCCTREETARYYEDQNWKMADMQASDNEDSVVAQTEQANHELKKAGGIKITPINQK